MRTKLKNIETGAVIERTFRSGEKVDEVRLERAEAQYLYSDGELLHFMDLETYEQFAMHADPGGGRAALPERERNGTTSYPGRESIRRRAPAACRSRRSPRPIPVSGATRPRAGTSQPTLETGLVVNVPLFIEVGDQLKIDTRSGQYVERVSR